MSYTKWVEWMGNILPIFSKRDISVVVFITLWNRCVPEQNNHIIIVFSCILHCQIRGMVVVWYGWEVEKGSESFSRPNWKHFVSKELMCWLPLGYSDHWMQLLDTSLGLGLPSSSEYLSWLLHPTTKPLPYCTLKTCKFHPRVPFP